MHSELFQAGSYKKLIRDKFFVADFLMKNIVCSKIFVFLVFQKYFIKRIKLTNLNYFHFYSFKEGYTVTQSMHYFFTFTRVKLNYWIKKYLKNLFCNYMVKKARQKLSPTFTFEWTAQMPSRLIILSRFNLVLSATFLSSSSREKMC